MTSLRDRTDLRELIQELPKTDLHVHLDGSLRLDSLIELARDRRIALPSQSPAGLKELVFKPHYRNLAEYLEGFRYTVACLQTAESLERAAFELAEDCQKEGVAYVEVRFAPQLHVSDDLPLIDVMRAVARGLERATSLFNMSEDVRAGRRAPFRAAIIVCALRMFRPEFSQGYRRYFESCGYSPQQEVFARASLDLARAALHFKLNEGLPVTGIDLAGQEKGYPADAHSDAFQVAHEGFLGKTVHAGEDYGPESIFMAIGDLHADRIGHGTWLLDPSRVTDPRITDHVAYIEALSQYVADRRITLEVCLTSNQQTVPELAGDLTLHPFGRMIERRLSTTICTDNRLVSNTTVTDEMIRAITTFDLELKQVCDIIAYGFKRSFFPGPYLEKRAYVRTVLDILHGVVERRFGRSALHGAVPYPA